MAKTIDENTTVFAEAMRIIGLEYEVKDISEDSYNMLVKKREDIAFFHYILLKKL